MSEIANFLDQCHELTEVKLHKILIRPMLEELGMSNIQHCHGNQERGKDFYYLSPGPYGSSSLHACQVKNQKTNARAGDPNSVHGLLEQIETALETQTAHPVTLKLQCPSHALVISTFAIPDRVLSNCKPRLDKLVNKVTFLCGETFAAFLKKNCPRTFDRIANISKPFREFQKSILQKHSEAKAFQLKETNDFDEVFVNLSIGHGGQRLNRHLVAGNIPVDIKAIHLPKPTVNDIERLSNGVDDGLGIGEAFQLRAAGGNVRESDKDVEKGGNILFSRVRVGGLFSDLLDICENVDDESRDANDLFSAIQIFDEVINLFGKQCMKADRARASRSIERLTLQRTGVTSIVNSNSSFLVRGCPGAGKTFLARRVATGLQDLQVKVIYFPCSRIRNSSDRLSDQILEYVSEASGDCSNEVATKIISETEVFVLDGCDEAASIESNFLADVNDLLFPGSIEIDLSKRSSINSLELPSNILSAFKTKSTASGLKLSLRRRLSYLESCCLRKCASGTTLNEAIQSLLQQHDKLPRVVMTCRDSIDLDVDKDFVVVSLLQMSNKQMKMFFEGWGKAHGHEVSTLLSFLDENNCIREVCRTPIAAIILFAIHLSKVDLPKNRGQLYARRFELLLQDWDSLKNVPRRNRFDKDIKLRFLSHIAFESHANNTVTIEKTTAKKIWDERFMVASGNKPFSEVVSELVISNGVLEESGNTIGFGHLSFQEYLAANSIILQQNFLFLAEKYGFPWWKNVTRFYCGLTDNSEALFEKVQERGLLCHDSDGFLEGLLEEIEFAPATKGLLQELLAGETEDLLRELVAEETEDRYEQELLAKEYEAEEYEDWYESDDAFTD